MVMAKACALALLLALGACASTLPPPAVPVAVKIPVAVQCPSPPAMLPPHLPIADLKSDSAAADTVRACAASIEILKDAVRQRDAVLDGYRTGN